MQTTPRETSTVVMTTSSTQRSTSTSSVTVPSLPTTTASLPTFTTPTQASQTILAPITSTTLDAASATSTASTQTGPGVGPIIGYVAAALGGIAVLFVIGGVIWKKFGKKEDPYEADPFDKDEFRRHSAMIPDAFDDDMDGAGHHHAQDMTEHHQYNNGMYAEHDPSMAGAGGVAGGFAIGSIVGAGAAAASAHNEGGGPRPPTMFQRHIEAMDAPAAYGQPGMPVGYETAYPTLPPLAANGADPYGAAGVAPMHNIANPYAHLDRVHSVSAGSALGRADSLASGNSNGQYQSAGHGFDMQPQHAEVMEETRWPQFNSPVGDQPHNPFDYQQQQQQSMHVAHGSVGSASGSGSGGYASPQQHPQVVQGLQSSLQAQPSLSYRNLTPGQQYHYPQQQQQGYHYPQQQQQQQGRPLSTADEQDAYGGVY